MRAFMIDEGATRPELHHYVAQFELAYFTGPSGKLWLYDRIDDKYRELPPKSAMAEKDYYAYSDKTGKVFRQVERFFSQIEGDAKPILDKLISGDIALSEEERAALGLFLLLKWVRTPATQERIEVVLEAVHKSIASRVVTHEEWFSRSLYQMRQQTGEFFEDEEDQEQLKQLVLSEEYALEFPRVMTIKHMLFLLEDLWPQIVRRKWVVCNPTRGRAFLTSDNPVVQHQVRTLPSAIGSLLPGLLTPWAQTITPLTPDLCLLLEPEFGSIESAVQSSDMVRYINNEVGLNSKRFVVGHNESLLSSAVKRTKIDTQQPRSFSVEVISESTEDIFRLRHR